MKRLFVVAALVLGGLFVQSQPAQADGLLDEYVCPITHTPYPPDGDVWLIPGVINLIKILDCPPYDS